MIHLKPINDDALDFICDVIRHKGIKKGEKNIIDKRKECIEKGIPIPPEQTYPERCQKILSSNKASVEVYDKDFTKDEWNDIVAGIPVVINCEGKDHADFQDLYDYRLSVLAKYRERLSRNNGGKTATCPICEVNSANTLDHYIPQTEFPLYVVHPRNLIPCCPECNGHKLGKVLDDNKERLYWDAFIDQQPTEQYLFCTATTDSMGLPKCQYEIRQGNIDNKTWKIISKTFEDFHLGDMYSSHSISVVNELRDNVISPIRNNQYTLLKAIELVKIAYTFSENVNDWKFVTKKALLDSEIFKNTVASELNRLGIVYTL